MKKEYKLILRAMKAALKVVEASERIRVKNDTKYGKSSAMRPGGVFSPNTEPQTGKNVLSEKVVYLQNYVTFLLEENAKIREAYKERTSKLTRCLTLKTKVIVGKTARIEELEKELLSAQCELRDLKRAKPIPTYLIDFDKAETVLLDGLFSKMKSEEKVVEDFAGDDTPHVEKLLEPLGDTPRTLVHLKSPELATETLVVLSPEGETLLKIVKDNSRKFEVK